MKLHLRHQWHIFFVWESLISQNQITIHWDNFIPVSLMLNIQMSKHRAGIAGWAVIVSGIQTHLLAELISDGMWMPWQQQGGKQPCRHFVNSWGGHVTQSDISSTTTLGDEHGMWGGVASLSRMHVYILLLDFHCLNKNKNKNTKKTRLLWKNLLVWPFTVRLPKGIYKTNTCR